MNTPEQDAQAQQELADMLKADTLRPEDVAALKVIMTTTRADDLVASIRFYYSDLDRANRTPRAFLYLHLGMVAGAFDQQVAVNEATKS